MEVLNARFRVTHWTGGATEAEENGVECALDLSPDPCESAPGKGFDLVLDTEHDGEKVWITHIAMIGPERCTCPAGRIAVWVDEKHAKASVDSYVERSKDVREGRKPTDSLELLTTPPDHDEPRIDPSTITELPFRNIDIGTIAIVGGVGDAPPAIDASLPVGLERPHAKPGIVNGPMQSVGAWSRMLPFLFAVDTGSEEDRAFLRAVAARVSRRAPNLPLTALTRLSEKSKETLERVAGEDVVKAADEVEAELIERVFGGEVKDEVTARALRLVAADIAASGPLVVSIRSKDSEVEDEREVDDLNRRLYGLDAVAPSSAYTMEQFEAWFGEIALHLGTSMSTGGGSGSGGGGGGAAMGGGSSSGGGGGEGVKEIGDVPKTVPSTFPLFVSDPRNCFPSVLPYVLSEFDVFPGRSSLATWCDANGKGDTVTIDEVVEFVEASLRGEAPRIYLEDGVAVTQQEGKEEVVLKAYPKSPGTFQLTSSNQRAVLSQPGRSVLAHVTMGLSVDDEMLRELSNLAHMLPLAGLDHSKVIVAVLDMSTDEADERLFPAANNYDTRIFVNGDINSETSLNLKPVSSSQSSSSSSPAAPDADADADVDASTAAIAAALAASKEEEEKDEERGGGGEGEEEDGLALSGRGFGGGKSAAAAAAAAEEDGESDGVGGGGDDEEDAAIEARMEAALMHALAGGMDDLDDDDEGGDRHDPAAERRKASAGTVSSLLAFVGKVLGSSVEGVDVETSLKDVETLQRSMETAADCISTAKAAVQAVRSHSSTTISSGVLERTDKAIKALEDASNPSRALSRESAGLENLDRAIENLRDLIVSSGLLSGARAALEAVVKPVSSEGEFDELVASTTGPDAPDAALIFFFHDPDSSDSVSVVGKVASLAKEFEGGARWHLCDVEIVPGTAVAAGVSQVPSFVVIHPHNDPKVLVGYDEHILRMLVLGGAAFGAGEFGD